MARRLRSGIEFKADFSSAIQMLGAGMALGAAGSDRSYFDDIIKAAWHMAENEFNLEAAAYASAGGRIRHMYEWGTLGINTGRTNMRPDPMSDRARLWTTHLTGSGMARVLSYTFDPSIAYVPKPTVRDTGMDPEVIDMLKDHVFTWKARVFESGETVTIFPTEAKMLLIPFYNGPPPGTPPKDVERGYRMSMGPHTFSPGEQTQGEFSAFWLKFWEGRGNEIMSKHVEEQLEMDFYPAIMTNVKTGPVPVKFGSITAEAKAEERRIARNARRRARYRERKEAGEI